MSYIQCGICGYAYLRTTEINQIDHIHEIVFRPGCLCHETIERLKAELRLHKLAVDNALAIFDSVVRGNYPKEDLLEDSELYIKGVELYKLGKQEEK